jgi:hypothetical protein
VTGEGEKAELLKIIRHIERAEWEGAEELARQTRPGPVEDQPVLYRSDDRRQ